MILKRFCCCCDLRIGAIFIGITQNLIALPALVLSFLLFGYRQEISHELRLSGDNHIIPLITFVLILCSFLKLCSCILLISGAMRRSHLELMPWLIIEGIGMVVSYITILILIVFILNVSPAWGLGMFLIGNLLIGIFIYWWLCVFSLYRQLQEQEPLRYSTIEQPVQ